MRFLLACPRAGARAARAEQVPLENSPGSRSRTNAEPFGRGAWLKAREDGVDKTVWQKELLAQTCGQTFEALWDSINNATNKLSLIAGFPLGEIVLPKWGSSQSLPHGIELCEPIGAGPTPLHQPVATIARKFRNDGWELENVEFRHTRFDTDENGQPGQSAFYFAARLTHRSVPERAIIEGNLVVHWAAKQPGEEFPSVKRIDASQLTARTRVGAPQFQLILRETITPPERSSYIDPLILYDLDGDAFSEIILAEKNRVYRRHGQEDHYEAEPLCSYPADFITSAAIADLDRDGAADLLVANSSGLLLFKGSPHGTFGEPARVVWPASPPLKNTMVLTCGDIDLDGDLDVFLGQYRVPTLGQVLRPYYYDANDGFPAYLLLNDGHGNLTDVTNDAGLVSKRWRRIYSASLADIDGDEDIDLLVVSDFAGLDLYQNDGHRRFTEVTRQRVADPHAFGMAHALADLNADGRLDLLMIGMPSPTVDRLEHLALSRPYSTEDRLKRRAMTFGNRLYLAQPNSTFEQTRFGDSLARSGWSWGCSVFDFDNDGFPDVYIANGLETKQSVRDYESEFWLHDLFVDEEIDDVTATSYLTEKSNRTRGRGWSYGGYEKNRLYLNQRGESFVEIGHLAGVALEQDSRNVVADDLDGDGRVDLLVTTLEVWPEVKQTLQVYKNTLSNSGHWIGFRFREQTGWNSPVGARVTLQYNGHRPVRQIVTGDSHRSQHAHTVHFGLGKADRVDHAEIRYTAGKTVSFSRPAINRYHDVPAPAKSTVLK